MNFTHHRGVKYWWFAKKYHFGDPLNFKRQYFQRVGLWRPTLDAIFNPRRFLSMTACYFVSKHACERLIDIGYPVRLPADLLTGLVAFNQLRLFKVFPDINYYVTYSGFESEITKIGGRSMHRLERD